MVEIRVEEHTPSTESIKKLDMPLDTLSLAFYVGRDVKGLVAYSKELKFAALMVVPLTTCVELRKLLQTVSEYVGDDYVIDIKTVGEVLC